MTKPQRYQLPGTLLLFGEHSSTELPNFINQFEAKKTLLVCSKGQLNRIKKSGDIKSLVETKNVFKFTSFSSHPSIEELEEGVNYALKMKPELVIGIGGGSAMDMAKSIALLCTNVKNAHMVKRAIECPDYIEKKRIRLIQVPSTAGTGSEVTRWATIWSKSSGKKLSFEHFELYADVAILDPLLTLTMPPRITAISGVDALCHAIEAYWARNSNFLSDKLALLAVEKIWGYIENAYREPHNLKFKTQVLKGSLLAGLAFNNTKTTAIHSISYALTILYGVPHGEACALLLPELLKYNYQAIPEKLHKIVALLNGSHIDEAVKNIRTKLKQIGIPTSLKEAGIKNVDTAEIIEKSYTPDRMENNPRRINRTELNQILKKIV